MPLYKIIILSTLIIITFIIYIKLIKSKNHILENTILNQYNLTDNIDKIIELYHLNNIKLPLDIIEELEHNKENLINDKIIISFIENHRYNWKLENQKKFKPPN